MDYSKTRELYQELDQIKKFEETADFNRYKKELKWYDVTSKRTGEYYQAEITPTKHTCIVFAHKTVKLVGFGYRTSGISTTPIVKAPT